MPTKIYPIVNIPKLFVVINPITVIGQAGVLSVHPLLLSNPSDKNVLIYIPKLTHRFSLGAHPSMTLSENGRHCFSLAEMSESTVHVEFLPVSPQPAFDYTLDFTTADGHIFHRFTLTGYVTVPPVFSTLRIVETERTKIRKYMRLPVQVTSKSKISSVLMVGSDI